MWHCDQTKDDQGFFAYSDDSINKFVENMFDPNSEDCKKYKVFSKAASLLPSDASRQAELNALKVKLDAIDEITTVEAFMAEYVKMLLFEMPLFQLYFIFDGRNTKSIKIYASNDWEIKPDGTMSGLLSVDDNDEMIELYKSLLSINDETEYVKDILDFMLAIDDEDTTVDENNTAMEDTLSVYLKANGIEIPVDYKNVQKYFHKLNLIGSDDIDSRLSLANAKKYLKHSIAKTNLNILLHSETSYRGTAFVLPLIKAYKEKYDPNGTKREYVRQMCEEIKTRLEERLNNNTWMSTSSKLNAIKKLKEIHFYCGYRDFDNPELLLEDDNDYKNCSTYIDFYNKISYNANLIYLKRFADDSIPFDDLMFEIFQYQSDPMLTNANYDFETNTVCIRISCLNGLCNIDYPDAYSYASLGFIVGHEICHGFDSNGSKHNEIGETKDWWTISDKLHYEDKKAQVTELYSMFALESDSTITVNGVQTLNENMADLGGITIAYDTFVSKKIKEGFSGDNLIKQKKMFFESLAILFSSTADDNHWANHIKTNTHSPYQFRVNGITSLVDEWYDLYNVQPGDKYYLEPSQRIVLW